MAETVGSFCLLATGKGEGAMTPRVRMIEISKIEPNCRCVYPIESIEEIVQSIRKDGQIEPIKISFYGICFRIIDGEKRWRACKKLGIWEIKAIIVEDVEE